MAVSEQAGPVTDPRECASGREFVRDRLAESDSPMSPADLSDEYDCTGGYMRDILSDLHAEGVVERPATGRYVLAEDGDGDPGEGTDGSVPAISDDGMAEIPDEDTDTDGSDQMPTEEEYRQQHRDSDDDEDDVSASSEQTGSDGNTSASAGSDAPDDSGSEADVGGVEDAAPAVALPVHPYKLGVVLVVLAALWFVYRNRDGESVPEPEPDAGGEQADDAADMDGGLVNGQ